MSSFAAIEPIRGVTDIPPKSEILGANEVSGHPQGAAYTAADFVAVFREALGALGRTETNYNELSQKVITGQPVDVHQVMIAAQEMNIAFQLALTVRNKVIEAYQEIMRMQV